MGGARLLAEALRSAPRTLSSFEKEKQAAKIYSTVFLFRKKRVRRADPPTTMMPGFSISVSFHAYSLSSWTSLLSLAEALQSAPRTLSSFEKEKQAAEIYSTW
eukprot:1194422-Prorocentrum_minimum.AAC.2